MLERALFYIFILSLVLVGVAYFAGVQTDANALGAFFRTVIYSATGRNAQGNFASYPKAA